MWTPGGASAGQQAPLGPPGYQLQQPQLIQSETIRSSDPASDATRSLDPDSNSNASVVAAVMHSVMQSVAATTALERSSSSTSRLQHHQRGTPFGHMASSSSRNRRGSAPDYLPPSLPSSPTATAPVTITVVDDDSHVPLQQPLPPGITRDHTLTGMATVAEDEALLLPREAPPALSASSGPYMQAPTSRLGAPSSSGGLSLGYGLPALDAHAQQVAHAGDEARSSAPQLMMTSHSFKMDLLETAGDVIGGQADSEGVYMRAVQQLPGALEADVGPSVAGRASPAGQHVGERASGIARTSSLPAQDLPSSNIKPESPGAQLLTLVSSPPAILSGAASAADLSLPNPSQAYRSQVQTRGQPLGHPVPSSADSAYVLQQAGSHVVVVQGGSAGAGGAPATSVSGQRITLQAQWVSWVESRRS